ncbi:hypothetical protein B0H17DRAFT_1227870 [Mycena rosella]|uniref:Protein kinase domain-containing protein n=1 Tax=Mycena rosella TaxID=1033263 RepID=A0AAD7GD08_MYCRO|nr:hypothetical protein B0H17DRAFT_1227870 [Mycena rosella]
MRSILMLFRADRFMYEIDYGASGTVWKALDLWSARLVAIKIFHPYREEFDDAHRVAAIHRILSACPDSRLGLFAQLLNEDTYELDGYLVFELGATSLDRFICGSVKSRCGSQSQYIVRQLLQAVTSNTHGHQTSQYYPSR